MTSRKIRLVHYLNQFFGGIGGEDKADVGVQVSRGAAGASRGLQEHLGSRGEVIATVICGDNYFSSHPEAARDDVLKAMAEYRPDVVVAGPAFNAGRYGLACAEVCKAVTEQLGIPSAAAMSPDNPAVAHYRRHLYIIPTGDSAASMRDALPRIASFACKLGTGEPIGSSQDEGYLARGFRRHALHREPAAERAVALLKAKLRGLPFRTEVPIEIVEKVPPAPPVRSLADAVIALVTTSGLVPKGNPDRMKHINESSWRCYTIENIDSLSSDDWEPIHGGYNAAHARVNPNVVVPVDVLREFEKEGRIKRLLPSYFVTVGMGTPVKNGEEMGRQIAERLLAERVDAVVLTST